MSKMEEQATYGRIVHIGPADERGRVTVTHEDGTSVTVRKDQLPPMSTTNDEQAPYGKQDQRAPMFIEPAMFFDQVSGLVTLRILGIQWAMEGEELKSRVEKFLQSRGLDSEVLTGREQIELSMELVMAHGTQIVKP